MSGQQVLKKYLKQFVVLIHTEFVNTSTGCRSSSAKGFVAVKSPGLWCGVCPVDRSLDRQLGLVRVLEPSVLTVTVVPRALLLAFAGAGDHRVLVPATLAVS